MRQYDADESGELDLDEFLTLLKEKFPQEMQHIQLFAGKSGGATGVVTSGQGHTHGKGGSETSTAAHIQMMHAGNVNILEIMKERAWDNHTIHALKNMFIV